MITQRYGDLEIGYTKMEVKQNGIGRPELTGDWHFLGDVTVHDVPASGGGLLVRDRSVGRDLLRPPVSFQKVGEFKGSFKYKILGNAAWTVYFRHFVWRPIPPAGYVALGDVTTSAANLYDGDLEPGNPSVSMGVACVKKEHAGRAYVRRAELGLSPTIRIGGGKAWWPITPPLYPFDDTEEHMFLPAGTFSCGPDVQHSPTDVTWVLDLPAVVEKTDYAPELTLESYNPPPAQAIVTDRAVTVPYVMVNDSNRTEEWKVDNSPFYKILRKRQYDLLRHVDFRGGGGGEIEEAITVGVTKERSDEFAVTTGITVGVSTGVEVSAKPLGMGASASVETSVSASLELGYARRYGVSEFDDHTLTVTYEVPADHAGALWTDTHQLVPVRGDGTLVTNENLKLNAGSSSSYVGRLYPSDAADKGVGVFRHVPANQLERFRAGAKELGLDLNQLPTVEELDEAARK
ncbi:hypothetical protein [Mangrovihabitans endophyticus]|nr:hypothetical protein [Mangrovihabitans endophyticus]